MNNQLRKLKNKILDTSTLHEINRKLDMLDNESQREYFYLGESRALIKLHTGQSFLVDTDSIDLSVPLILNGSWESWIEEPMLEFLTPGNFVIDCGANMGYYSTIMMQKIGREGTLHAFEPNPRAFSFLKNNIAINGFSEQACLHQTALSNEESTSSHMWISKEFSGGSYLTSDLSTDMTNQGFYLEKIQTQKLDNIITEKTVDLIKIDVEGFEPNLLFGAQNILERSKNIILIIELSPSAWEGQGHSPKEVFKYLEELKFQFKIALPGEKLLPSSADELIDYENKLGFTTCFFASRNF